MYGETHVQCMCTALCAPAHDRIRSLIRPLMKKKMKDMQCLLCVLPLLVWDLGFWVQTEFGTSGKVMGILEAYL